MPLRPADASFAALLEQAVNRLAKAGCAMPHKDADLLLQSASGLERAGLIARGADRCPEDVAEVFSGYILRREKREPVFRILGEREFHGLALKLSSETLEPRDDTECLVDLVLEMLPERKAGLRFLDLGTGSGAIALALLHELQNARAVATDISTATLEVACRNAATHGLEPRFRAVESSWFDEVDGVFDFVVSNPPYIESHVVDHLEPEVLQYDPRVALDGGADGLDAYRAIFQTAASFLTNDGFLGFEIGHNQLQSVTALGEEYGWHRVNHAQDLGGNDRAVVFRLKASVGFG